MHKTLGPEESINHQTLKQRSLKEVRSYLDCNNMDPSTKLMYTWNYWGLKKSFPDYVNNLFIIKSFDNLEGFAMLYNVIKNPNKQIKDGDVFSIFKSGIMPLVDDPKNECGGEWKISYPRDDNGYPVNIKEDWLKVMLLIVGGWFGQEQPGICGADLDVRGNVDNSDVISVWNNDWMNAPQIANIRATLTKHLTLSSNVSVSYHTHH